MKRIYRKLTMGAMTPSISPWWLAVALATVTIVGAGCGSGAARPASPVASSDPAVVSTALATGAGPTRESAARFGAEVVGRLEQEAFWAEDDLFLTPVVSPAAHEEVAGVLDTRVGEVRWAIASFPGPTRRTWFATAPLTVEVAAFDPGAGTAQVRVWVVSVFSREDLGPPETRFSTEQADLVWDAATYAWRITGLSTTIGPSAALADDEKASTPAELDAALAGHRLIGPTTGEGP